MMRLSATLSSGRNRRLLFGGIAVVAALSTIVIWVSTGPPAAAAVLLVWFTVGATTKLVVETTVDARRASSVQQAKSEAIGGRLNKLEQDASALQARGVVDRIRAVEEATARQRNFNEAIVDRMRNVERRVKNVPGPDEAAEPELTADNNARREQTRAVVAAARANIGRVATSRQHGEGAPRITSPVSAQVAPQIQEPTVTVVVPCYNNEREVAATIESVRRQSYPTWECVVVDDASTDGSLAAIRAIASVEARVRVIARAENQGAGSARNLGAREAQGHLITFLDADDLLMADSLLERVEAFVSSPYADTAGAFCGVRLVNEFVELDDLPPWEPWKPPTHVLDFVSADGENKIPVHSPLVRTDIVLAHGGFRSGFDAGEDRHLWDRIMRSGYVLVPAAHRTAIYRQQSGSWSNVDYLAQHETHMALTAWAYRPAAPDELRGDARFPFPEPLGYYRRILTSSRRAVMYAAMALVQSDMDSVRRVLATLQPGTWPLLERHIDFDYWTAAGFRRGLGVVPAELSAHSGDLETVATALRAMIEAATSELPVPEEAPTLVPAPHSQTQGRTAP